MRATGPRVIDLEEYRRRREEKASTPAVAPGPTPVVWVPVWMWVPCWPIS